MLIHSHACKELIDGPNAYRLVIEQNKSLDRSSLVSVRRAKTKRSGDKRTLTSSFDVTPREGSESTNMGLEPTAFR